MWQPELIGMAAAIWPALFCLIEPPRAYPSNKSRGANSDGLGYASGTCQEPDKLNIRRVGLQIASLHPELESHFPARD
jgi:hypothetical protein